MSSTHTLFDVNVWYRVAQFLRQFACSEDARIEALNAPYAPPSAQLLAAALRGEHGKVSAHGHIWRLLERKLGTEKGSRVSAQEAPVFITIFKRWCRQTGGNPEVVWDDDHRRGEHLVLYCNAPDFEDARVVMGALALHRTQASSDRVRIITHDRRFAFETIVPGVAVQYVDPLSKAQRAAENINRDASRRRAWREFQA